MNLATGCGNASLAEATFPFIIETIVYIKPFVRIKPLFDSDSLRSLQNWTASFTHLKTS
jgi:hypothetical protein